MHEREPAGQALVAQVGEVARKLGGGQHALVDHGPARGARDGEAFHLRVLHHTADHVELALEGVLVGDPVARAYEQLADVGRGGAGHPAALAGHHRRVAPAQDVLALGLHRPLEQLHGLRAAALVAREEARGYPVAALLGQLEVHRLAEEPVRELHQDPGAVTGVGVGALRAAVLEALEREQRACHHLVRGGAAQARDERDAAGVVVEAWVVQPIGGPAAGP
jgi:hypothetical protein